MKTFIFLAMFAVLLGCSNKDKLKKSETAPPPAEEQTEVDQAREQRLEQLMNQVGNVHAPFKSELISNIWCAVIDDNLTVDSASENSIQFDRHDQFEVVAPDSEGNSTQTRGAYALRDSSLYLVNERGDEETANVSLARSPDTILLKLTVLDKPSLLYRDCSPTL